MAKRDFNIHTELTAKIDDLTAKLNTANQRVNYFKSNAAKNRGEDAMFKSMLSGVAGFLPAIGAATIATQVFSGTVATTQAAGDKWEETKAQMTGALEGFYRTMGTGDWDNFIQNVMVSSKAAKELTRQLDTLFEMGVSRDLQNIKLDLNLADLQKQLRLANARGDYNLVLELEAAINETANQKLDNSLKVANQRLDAFADNISDLTGIGFDRILDFLESFNDESVSVLRNIAQEYNAIDTTQERQGRKQAEAARARKSELESIYGDELKIYAATMKAYDRVNDDKIIEAKNAQVEISRLQIERINETSRAEVTAAGVQKRIDEEAIKRQRERLELLAKTAPKQLSLPEWRGIDLGESLEMSYSGLPKLQQELNELVRLQNLSADPERYRQLQVEIDEVNLRIKEFKGELQDVEVILMSMEQYYSNMGNAFSSLADSASRFGSNTLAGMLDALGATFQLAAAMEALTNIQAQNAATSAVASGAKVPFPGNLIAITSGLAAVFAALSSIPKFATGGIVGGSSFIGDKVLAGVNSGEMILNKSQQANLFKMINDGQASGGNVVFEIKGDKLVGVLNNYSKRKSLIS